jgi:hypothetical protein
VLLADGVRNDVPHVFDPLRSEHCDLDLFG